MDNQKNTNQESQVGEYIHIPTKSGDEVLWEIYKQDSFVYHIKSGLKFSAISIKNVFSIDGVLKTLETKEIDFEAVNLDSCESCDY